MIIQTWLRSGGPLALGFTLVDDGGALVGTTVVDDLAALACHDDVTVVLVVDVDGTRLVEHLVDAVAVATDRGQAVVRTLVEAVGATTVGAATGVLPVSGFADGTPPPRVPLLTLGLRVHAVHDVRRGIHEVHELAHCSLDSREGYL